MSPQFATKDWSAWLDLMPDGSKPILHVTGTVTCSKAGYTAKLTPSSPQGINPEIYLLDLVIRPPSKDDGTAQVITDIPVYYEENTRTPYTHVTIMPEGITVKVNTIN